MWHLAVWQVGTSSPCRFASPLNLRATSYRLYVTDGVQEIAPISAFLALRCRTAQPGLIAGSGPERRRLRDVLRSRSHPRGEPNDGADSHMANR